MNLQEIINRPNGSVFDRKELEFVVEQYIYKMKGIRVNINTFQGIPNHPMMAKMIAPTEIQKLNMAFGVAQQYFLNK